MPRYKVHGSLYEPGEFANKDGYIVFYDILEAEDEAEAIVMAAEDYGDYNAITVHGIAETKQEEKAWIKRNPD